MNTTILKQELVSFLHTFLAIFVVSGLPLLVNFDFQKADKAALSALGFALIRSMIKATYEKFSAPAQVQG